MRPALFALALSCAAVPCAGAAQEPPPALSWTYVCDGGAVLQVAYLNPADGPSLAVVGWAGRLVPMQAGPTGSGVRYVAVDAADGYVWHAKGEAGTLMAADAAGAETVILSGCARAGG